MIQKSSLEKIFLVKLFYLDSGLQRSFINIRLLKTIRIVILKKRKN